MWAKPARLSGKNEGNCGMTFVKDFVPGFRYIILQSFQ